MKATRIDGQAVNGRRNRLADDILLDTPYAITIFPIYACNFRCNYCIHSLPRNKRVHVANEPIMDMGLYKKCIDDLKAFPRQLKALHFAGLGEPLLHPQIAEMVDYAVKNEVAEVVDIITNGSLLTNELSEKLIAAGLNKLRISLQGLNSEMYQEMSGVDIDFEQFYQQLMYFYQHRQACSVYIKILDVSLKEKREQEFLEKFGGIADNIAIERLCPLLDDIDYHDSFDQGDFVYTMNGNRLPAAEV